MTGNSLRGPWVWRRLSQPQFDGGNYLAAKKTAALGTLTRSASRPGSKHMRRLGES